MNSRRLIGAICALTATVTAAGLQIYSHPIHGYRLQYPTDWSVRESNDRVVTFQNPDRTVVIVFNQGPDTERMKKSIKLGHFGNQVHGKTFSPVTLAGVQAMKVTQLYRSEEIRYYVPHLSFILSITVRGRLTPELKPTVEKILKSLEFEW